MLYKMLVAPLSAFDGGGGVTVVDGAVGGEPDVVGGVVEPSSTGGVVGVLGVPLAATTVIASFMPPEQWPDVGQMKYIGPAVDKGTVELPSV